jgi:DNA replication protein DnaC
MGTTISDFDEKVLNTFTCQGCDQEVQEIQARYLFGEKKGELFQAFRGCKCEDLRLGREALKNYERLKKRKTVETFLEKSIIPKSLEKASFSNYNPKTAEQEELFT